MEVDVKPRAIWKGAIGFGIFFGILYVPVEVYPAMRATHTPFDLLPREPDEPCEQCIE